MSEEWTKEEKRNIRVNSKFFAVISHRLFRTETDRLLRIYVSEVVVPSILVVGYKSACGGHFFANLPAKKFLEYNIYVLPCSRIHMIM